MPNRTPNRNALVAKTFGGRMPTGSGDLAVETHGITPIPEDNRYGSPRRLFTVWFAPQMNVTGVFTGSLAIVFGLGFWLGLLAMVIGTILGSLPVAYLSTWGPRTGTGQLPASRMAFGGTVILPGHRPVAVLHRLGRPWSGCSAVRPCRRGRTRRSGSAWSSCSPCRASSVSSATSSSTGSKR